MGGVKKFVPRPAQEALIKHFLTHDVAYASASMGLGKTGGTLAAFNKLYSSGESIGMMVLAPLRVCNLVWKDEIDTWLDFKHFRVANLRTPLGRQAFIAGRASIYLLNYDSIPLLVKLIEKRGGTVPYDTIVYDEVDSAKSADSKRIALLRREVPRVKRNWGMTGTMMDKLVDLFAQFRLLDEGERLGRSFQHFKSTYFHKADYMGYKWDANDGAKELIEKRICDITITLRASEWMPDMPDAVVQDVDVHMTPDQLSKYQEFERELVLELKSSVTITAPSAAALVTKLLQYTSGAVYDENGTYHCIHDLKLEALKKIIKKTKGPVLVVAIFKHEQARLREAFPNAVFFADAATLAAQTKMLAEWNRKEIPVLVVSPFSASHGLNMQWGGSTMVWMSLIYSHRRYTQMLARLARPGQVCNVDVYRLMCPGTVDDAIATILEDKRDTEDRLLSALMMLESSRDVGLSIKPPEEPDFNEEDFWG
jgi:SNF2 family DNA or RNA helicase